MFKNVFRKMTYPQFIVFGFLAVIFLGAILLCLPVSSASGNPTDFLSALFTATSATCVTGLSVYDTFSYWSRFGHIVILVLIQIGGLGFMSVFTMLSVFSKKRISLGERKILVQVSGNMRYHGVVIFMKKIVFGTILFEGTGAILLAFRFCRMMPSDEGLFYAVFHSVSAFCNAGFDLMSQFYSSGSFTAFSGDIFINLVLIALIVIGGIGFLVWDDFSEHKFHLKKYCLHSKLALCFSAILLSCGFFVFLITEWNASFAEMPVQEKLISALFQSATVRTAGFNTVPQGELSEAGKLFSIILMAIGGSPASTAGGIKTTTVFIALLSAVSSARNVRNVTVFKKRIDESTVKQATSIVFIYLSAIIAGSLIIAAVEPFSLSDILFEVVSAAGTVGLSVGITSELSVFSKTLLIFLMFFGRIGGLSLVLALAEKRTPVLLERPIEKVLIG